MSGSLLGAQTAAWQGRMYSYCICIFRVCNLMNQTPLVPDYGSRFVWTLRCVRCFKVRYRREGRVVQVQTDGEV
jgi:hypothetical protein